MDDKRIQDIERQLQDNAIALIGDTTSRGLSLAAALSTIAMASGCVIRQFGADPVAEQLNISSVEDDLKIAAAEAKRARRQLRNIKNRNRGG